MKKLLSIVLSCLMVFALAACNGNQPAVIPAEPGDVVVDDGNNGDVDTPATPAASDVKVGFSDHVAPDETMMTLAVAYMLGSDVIEKHFTLNKTLPGNDHYHAGEGL